MKKLLILLMFLSGLNLVKAADRSDAEIYKIAHQQLFGGNQRRAAGEAQLREMSKTDQYVVMGTEDAFVIVSKNDAFTPVLAVSHTPFQAGNMPDGFNWWLRTITECMEAGTARRAAGFTPIENFVMTQWGQYDPYNGMCPKVAGSYPPTGCAATAMAQVLKYYQYPSQGVGTGTYTVGSTTKTVSIKNEYRWDRMINNYTSTTGSKPNALQKVAVQYLMKDAGASCNMIYAKDGSSSTCYDAALGFINNFQYDSLAISYGVRSLYADDEWMEMIYQNLAQSRPILYGASDKKAGGHAFILSGVDNEGKVYVNWGWNGDADGFYDFADLAPVNKGKEMGYHFNEDQTMITGILPIPSSGTLRAEEYKSLWVCTEKYFLKPLDKNVIELVTMDIWNYSLINFTGELQLYFENTTGGTSDYLLFYDTEKGSPVPSGSGFYNQGEYMRDTIDVTDLQAGTYKVYFRSKDVRETEPQISRVDGQGLYLITVTKHEDGTIVSSEVPDEPTAIQSVKSAAAAVGSSVRYYDLQGREVDSQTPGLLIRKQGSKVKKIMVK